jgi:5'-nucleotidase
MFPPEYADQSNAIFDKYHPIEIDPSLSLEIKKQAMTKWRDEQFNLMLSYGLTRDVIKQAITSESTNFRT